jgi:CRP/FNR family transcriptional regulator, cyclic AMP receptor protein
MVPVTRVDPETLSRFKRFADLPRPKLRRLAIAMTICTFERRERIYSQREDSKNLYILLGGVAKLSGLNRADQPVLMALVSPGEMFGISAVLPVPVHRFYCDAFTDCMVAKIEPRQFVEILLGASLNEFQTVMGMLVSGIEDLLTRHSMMLRLAVKDRLLAAFAELGSKFGSTHEKGTLLNLPLTHKDLADLVGATRPIVTLQLKDLERNGAIFREHRRLVLVPEKLSGEGLIDPPAEVFMPNVSLNGGRASVGPSEMNG